MNTGPRMNTVIENGMGWLRLSGSLKLSVSFAKEPCKTDYILQIIRHYVSSVHSYSGICGVYVRLVYSVYVRSKYDPMCVIGI